MSANIHRDQQGKDAMFSLRQNPWHKLGKVIDVELTDDQVLPTAGLNWTVDGEPIYAFRPGVGADGNLVSVQEEVEGYKLLRRSDSGAPYGVVGANYRVFQNTEMVRLLRQIAGQTPVIWETAGALGTGQTVWVLGRLPELELNIGGDKTLVYMLVTNGHGNYQPLRVMPTTIRVVCQNTFGLAIGGLREDSRRAKNTENLQIGTAYSLTEGFSIRHTRGLDVAVQDVTRAYAKIVKGSEATKEAFELLDAKTITYSQAADLWEAIFSRPAAEDETRRAQSIRENRDGERARELHHLWNSPTNANEGRRQTVFAAFQTAVEYIDHVRPTRGEGDVTAKRLKYSVFGDGWNLKDKAFTQAMAVAQV